MKAVAANPKTKLAPAVAEFCACAVEALRAKLPVREVWLFGSQAEGTANEHSDYDFLVVLADAHGIYRPNLECYTAIRDAVGSEPLDVVSLPANRWETERSNPASVYADIATKGVRVA